VACLIASIICMENQDAIQRELDFCLRTYNMQFMKDIFYDVKRGKCLAVMFCVTFSNLCILNNFSNSHFPVTNFRIKSI
jgi:hypothetical protein